MGNNQTRSNPAQSSARQAIRKQRTVPAAQRNPLHHRRASTKAVSGCCSKSRVLVSAPWHKGLRGDDDDVPNGIDLLDVLLFDVPEDPAASIGIEGLKKLCTSLGFDCEKDVTAPVSPNAKIGGNTGTAVHLREHLLRGHNARTAANRTPAARCRGRIRLEEQRVWVHFSRLE